MEGAVIDGKYRIERKFGIGSHGVVYVGTDLDTKENVAMKMERVDATHGHLYHEYRVYRAISGTTGIPKARWYGTDTVHLILVMDFLGPTLGELFMLCGHKFSVKTVLMLADQLIERIEHLHARNFLHRDLKPDNILMGPIGEKENVVHIIDFGLAKSFRDPKTLCHIPEMPTKGFTGTARYASIDHHNGVEQSRRDDMESLGYLLLYFLRGNLPWQDVMPDANLKQTIHETMRLKKMATSIESLCESHPKEFASYFHYCRSLGFEDTPDYAYLRKLFRDLFLREGFQYDNMFDWNTLHQQTAQSSTAVPRLPVSEIDMVPGVKDGHGAPETVKPA